MPKEVKKSSDNSFGILAVTLGILSIVLSLTVLIGSFAGVALGILGLIFAIIQGKRNKNSWSKAGIWLSVIGIIIGLIFISLFISAIIEIARQVQELQASGALDAAALAG